MALAYLSLYPCSQSVFQSAAKQERIILHIALNVAE